MLKLQNILLPSSQTCMDQELYFRCSGTGMNFQLDPGNSIRLEKGTVLEFDTYFNGFFIEKWNKYTGIDNIVLTLRLEGAARVVLMTRSLLGDFVETKVLGTHTCRSKKGQVQEFTLEFETQPAGGMCCFSIEAEEQTVFYGGSYCAGTELEWLRSVKLGLVICTYERERFIKKNLELLRKAFLENPDSQLYDKLEIFVVDNAGTLQESEIAGEKVHCFKNKNTGGAGGFTRGMLEVRRLAQEQGFTHVLLTDDDIVLEPEAVFRTGMLLTCVCDAYRDAFVGGAMLRLDTQYLQTEAGAVWNAGEIVSLKKGLDLRKVRNCLSNAYEEKAEYHAWWFCAFPLALASDENLPMPLFLLGDDAEYGLRNMKQLILLNGICVWHEPVENKYSSARYYYMFRNKMIVNALHSRAMTRSQYKKLLTSAVRYELQLYRYKNAHLLMQAAEDFLGGVTWLKAQDGAKVHKWVTGQGYQPQPIAALGEDITYDRQMYETSRNDTQKPGLLQSILADRTLNGTYLSPKRKYNIIPMDGAKPFSVYRTEKILNYDEAGKKGFVTQRDPQEAKESLARLKRLHHLIDTSYEDAVRDYAENSRKLQTYAFWKKYLELDDTY